MFKKFEVFQREDVFKVNTDGALCAIMVKALGKERMLEVGSGTGVMSLILAQKFPEAEIVTIEIQPEAAALTRLNIRHNTPLSEHIKSVEGDIKDYHPDVTFDIIISNPPYYQRDSLSTQLHHKIAKHDIALNRMDFLKSIQRLTHENSVLYVVFPVEEGRLWMEEAAAYQWFPQEIIQVKPAADKPCHRLLIRMIRRKEAVQESELSILDTDRQYTEAYRKRCKDFYLIFDDE